MSFCYPSVKVRILLPRCFCSSIAAKIDRGCSGATPVVIACCTSSWTGMSFVFPPRVAPMIAAPMPVEGGARELVRILEGVSIPPGRLLLPREGSSWTSKGLAIGPGPYRLRVDVRAGAHLAVGPGCTSARLPRRRVRVAWRWLRKASFRYEKQASGSRVSPQVKRSSAT